MTIAKLIQHHKDMLGWEMDDESRKFHYDAISFLEALVESINILQNGGNNG